MEVTDSPTMNAEMLSTFRAQMKQTQGIHFSKYLRCLVILVEDIYMLENKLMALCFVAAVQWPRRCQMGAT